MPRIRMANASLMQTQSTGTPVTVTGSPFTYTATQPSLAVVSGGIVTLVETSADGVTFISVGLLAGQFVLPAGWSIRITAPITKPTLTLFPL
jgi:hypothetical protein